MYPLLSVSGLGRQVQNRWVWQGLDFDLYPGERLAVVGASGTGKSLLLRTLCGLDSVQQGQIIFQGKPLTSWSMPQYRTQIIYLHQRPALLEGTVEENLRCIYKFAYHRDKAYNHKQILAYLQILGRSEDFLDFSCGALSGGEAQIVAFLRALQLAPLVLLLDEPTASLDRATSRCLESVVEAWQNENSDRAYIWTSHDPIQIGRVSDRQITLPSKN